jgi:formamidopyrimidine-DNA glycosylase
VGKTIKKATAPDDANVFGKVGTSGPAFEKAVTGKKVVGAGSQGKYFWILLDSPPHPVMHFGMTGKLYKASSRMVPQLIVFRLDTHSWGADCVYAIL